jgi:hypothetical protein
MVSEPINGQGVNMSAVLVVGADQASVAANWNPSLANAGVNVVGHWDWSAKPQKELPKGCEGVLVLEGHAGALLVDGAKALAKKKGIPFVLAGDAAAAVTLLHNQGLTVNGDTIMRIVDGKIVLPTPPTDSPRWMKVISMETIVWAVGIAHTAYTELSPTHRAKLSTYVLETDAAGKSLAGTVPHGLKKTLAGFSGNPSGLALLINMAIPTGAALATKTVAKIYRAATKKGMDGYPAHMSAWATGRRVRTRDEPAYNQTPLGMANATPDVAVTIVKAAPKATPKATPKTDTAIVVKKGSSKDQIRIDALEGQVSRLEFDLEAKKKAHMVTVGKHAYKSKALIAANRTIEALEAAGPSAEALAAAEAVVKEHKDERDVTITLLATSRAETETVRVQNDELVNENHHALVLADKAADELVAAKAETTDFQREFQALRRTVDAMLELGPDATLRDLYDSGYYVLKSRRYNPNADQSIDSSSLPDNG